MPKKCARARVCVCVCVRQRERERERERETEREREPVWPRLVNRTSVRFRFGSPLSSEWLMDTVFVTLPSQLPKH